MSSPITIIATLTPKAGKAAALIEGLTKMATYVKANEPGTLAYSINQEVQKDQDSKNSPVIMIEIYKDQAAIDAHVKSSAMAAFQKEVKGEDLLEKPMELRFLNVVGGFASKL